MLSRPKPIKLRLSKGTKEFSQGGGRRKDRDFFIMIVTKKRILDLLLYASRSCIEVYLLMDQ